MEEEGGDDSEMIDAMDGWDSEDDSTAAQGADSATTPATEETKADWDTTTKRLYGIAFWGQN